MDSYLVEKLRAAVEEAGDRCEEQKNLEQDHYHVGFRSVLGKPYLPSRLVENLEEYGLQKPEIQMLECEEGIQMFRAKCFGYGLVGDAISNSKTLCKEIACDQFLKQLRQRVPERNLPELEVPDVIFVDPSVVAMLEAEFDPVTCKAGPLKIVDDMITYSYKMNCTDKGGVEYVGKATGVDLAYVKLEAAMNLWKDAKKSEDYPTFMCNVGDKLDEALHFFATWNIIEDIDDGDTNTDDELDKLVQEREKEKLHSQVQLLDDTTDELDKMVEFEKLYGNNHKLN